MRQTLRSALFASVLAAGAVLPAVALAQPARPPVEAALPGRLPTAVVPAAYDIKVTPNPTALTFEGSVAITVEVRAPTDRVVLNAADLTFKRVLIDGRAARFALDAEAETATLTPEAPLRPGAHTVTIDYSGKIAQQASGLFALDYPTESGGKARALFTQFENSDARRFVPSWDEPGRKAVFTLAVTAPANQTVVSNMPAASERPAGAGLKTVSFKPSPKMSSYLLFLSMGDLERTTLTSGGVEHGIVARRGPGAAQAQFALKASADILPWYNDYFGVAYPLPKLDHLAGPGSSQFFGAMENWGAIFYFERVLLSDPRLTTPAREQRNWETIAHEMAHQWFGDLVTMSWWDDLWLNEGYASWMATKAMGHFHPEWKPEVRAVFAREQAMGLDSRAGSHPIVQKIATVQQASQAFDSITYEKGEAVIGMIEAYLGETAFRDGVRRYMKAHAYGNTVTADLWSALEQASGKPVTAIADDFTNQTGVPLVRVTASRCQGGTTVLRLQQDRFGVDAESKAPTAWRVPVTPLVAGGRSVSGLVEGARGAEIRVPGCGPVVVNGGQTGYFRTLYPQAELQALTAGLTRLAPRDQLGLLSDTYELGRAGYQPMTGYLDMARALPLDAEPLVVAQLVGALSAMGELQRGRPGEAAFQAYVRARLAPLMARLGWEPRPGEDANLGSLRSGVIGALSEAGDPAVVAEARRRFAAVTAPGAQVAPATRAAVLNVTAANADRPVWDQLRALARNARNPIEKAEYYGALGAAKDDALAAEALRLAITDEPPVTEGVTIVASVAGHHPMMALDFVQRNATAVEARLDVNSRTRYVPRLAGGASDPAVLERLRAYAATLPPGTRRPTDMAVAAVAYRVQVREQRLPEVDRWIAAQTGSKTASAPRAAR